MHQQAMHHSILFVPVGSSDAEQQIELAAYFESAAGFRPHFLFVKECDEKLFRAVLDAHHWSAFHLPTREHRVSQTRIEGRERRTSRPRRLLARTAMRTSALAALQVARISADTAACYAELQKRARAAAKIIGEVRPSCAITSQERVIEVLPILKVLRRAGIPILLNLEAECSPDPTAWERQRVPELWAGLNAGDGKTANHQGHGLVNRLIEWQWPDQVYRSPWGRVLFKRSPDILAMKLAGMLPRTLWYQGTTFCDYIVVSGQDEIALCEEGGIAREKIRLIGAPAFDALHQGLRRRRELRQRLVPAYGLSSERKLLIYAPGHLWEHHMLPKEVHFEQLRNIVARLARTRFDVLVTLHQRSDPREYAWMEQTPNIVFCKERLKDVLPAADVFMATYSSTVRWAASLGIPTINVDLPGLHAKMYRRLKGIRAVYNTAELAEALESFESTVDDPRPSPDFMIDGRSKERLLQFVESIVRPSV